MYLTKTSLKDVTKIIMEVNIECEKQPGEWHTQYEERTWVSAQELSIFT